MLVSHYLKLTESTALKEFGFQAADGISVTKYARCAVPSWFSYPEPFPFCNLDGNIDSILPGVELGGWIRRSKTQTN